MTDSGPGILPTELENIFSPFNRITHKNSPTKGMGLGLTIAREIIEAHGGTIEVKSELNRSSQFTIWLPRS